MHQEAVQLRLGQRIGAFLLDGVLGGHDHEEFRQRVGHRAHGDLALAHGLEQRGLDLGRGPVDLVGQHQVVEQRPLAEHERPVLGPVDLRAGQVGGQQVGRELQTMKIPFHAVAQDLDRSGLGEPRCTLHQQMPVAQQRHEHAVQKRRLPDDEGGEVSLEADEVLLQGHGLERSSKRWILPSPGVAGHRQPVQLGHVGRRLGSSEDERDAQNATGSDAGAGSSFSQRQRVVGFCRRRSRGVYALVRATLVGLGYLRLGKPDKGLVKRYLGKVTGG